MQEKFKESRDKEKNLRVFSRTFLKLSWYGVASKSFKLILSYLSNWIQGVSINNAILKK